MVVGLWGADRSVRPCVVTARDLSRAHQRPEEDGRCVVVLFLTDLTALAFVRARIVERADDSLDVADSDRDSLVVPRDVVAVDRCD